MNENANPQPWRTGRDPLRAGRWMSAKKSAPKRGTAKPTLLTGGNPQIAKAEGNAPVEAYIAAISGWKRAVGRLPLPPGESKQESVGYLDIHETDTLDEAQFASWVKQASQLPGWVP